MVAHVKTYDQNNLKEDVSDIIFDISPEETPFVSAIRKGTCSSTNPEWHEDSLDPAATNSQVEGADAPAASQTATVNRKNYTQIFSKTVLVSGTSRSVDQYGASDELTRQLSKKGREIKLDLEYACVGANQAASAGDSATARTMASAQNMIDAANTNENAGVTRDLDEAILLDTLEKTFVSGGMPNLLLIPTSKAITVAGFAAASGRTRDVGADKKIVNAVDIYVSPYGEITVGLSRLMDSSTALALDTEMWELDALRPFASEELAKTGDADKHQIVGEYTLKHNNFKASGLIKDLN
jgi:hypothetical protein